MSLTTSASRPLAASLPRPCSTRLRRRARRRSPTSVCPSPAAPARLGEHVGGRLQRSSRRSRPAFLILPSSGVGGREVGDGGGHQQDVAGGNSCSHAACSSAALTTSTRRTPGGVGQRDVGGHERRPRRPARGPRPREREAHPPGGAVADEADAVDRLARAAGGDEHRRAASGSSAPPPRPAAAPPLGGRSRAPPRRPRAGCAGSARRPTPCSPSRPGGPRRARRSGAPRAAACRRFAWVAGCSYMRVVHRRGEHAAGSGAASAQLRQQVVGQARGELGDRVGGGRGDQVHVGVGDQLEVAERLVRRARCWSGEGAARGVALELADEHRRAGQRRERGRRRRSAGWRASARRARRARRRSPGARARAPCRRRCRR